MSKPPIDDAQIREAAYRLWQDEGQPEGRDQDHWSKAVEALTPEQIASPAETPAEVTVKPARKPVAKAAAKAAKPVVKKEAKPKAPAKPRKAKAE